MGVFFSCDWGTSTFRLRLVDSKNQQPLSEIKTDYGISSAFAEWKQTQKNRVSFYHAYLQEQVNKMSASFNANLQNVPLVLSGMASSSIGMFELPYKELPFKCDGSDLYTKTFSHVKTDLFTTIMISGVKSEDDVIRGEETMIAGCMIADDEPEKLFIFPGTHSKHILVGNGVVHQFATYMTGEIFDLLSKRSILSGSVKKNNSTTSPQVFSDGVAKGASTNLLNCIFQVRTNQLFEKLTPEENYHYLSGLLIGHELKDLGSNQQRPITLVCSNEMKDIYIDALNVLGHANRVNYKNADAALINGQCRIMQYNPDFAAG